MRYFGHDTDAHMDEKHLLLFSKYGAEGYGLYWLINERIGRKMNEKVIDCKLCDPIEILASLSKMSVENATEIMEFMVSIELLSLDDGFYYNHKLKDRVDEYTRKKMRNLGIPDNVRKIPDNVRPKEKKSKA